MFVVTYAPKTDAVPLVEPESRSEWRRWLTKNYTSSSGVWLVFRKEPLKRNLSYSDAVEEALCFGWIDSRPNKIDETHYKQFYSPRKPGSAWSVINRRRAEALIADGHMTPAGLEKINAAKRDGSWTRLDLVETLQMPSDLASALKRNPRARTHFEAFPPSSKKIILNWIYSAKREETRTARVRETVELAARNLRANHWRQ